MMLCPGGTAPLGSLMLHFMSGPAASTAEMPGPGTDGVQRIQAVDRAIVLLKAVAASTTPPTVLELARLPAPIEVAAYYVMSEALANAAKHARASLIDISVTPRDGRL